ncbi:ribonuclease H [Senna tora]|uniref:Ribonuclease H n=1 Tax=Senna tora TaxID=362788 RepID=A0A834TLN0_9FABA|nr:ribonuclease H [Senna tora]
MSENSSYFELPPHPFHSASSSSAIWFRRAIAALVDWRQIPDFRMQVIINSHWKLQGAVTVKSQVKNFYMLDFENEEDWSFMILNGPWVVKKSFNYIAYDLGALAGEVIDLDPENDTGKHLEFARVKCWWILVNLCSWVRSTPSVMGIKSGFPTHQIVLTGFVSNVVALDTYSMIVIGGSSKHTWSCIVNNPHYVKIMRHIPGLTPDKSIFNVLRGKLLSGISGKWSSDSSLDDSHLGLPQNDSHQQVHNSYGSPGNVSISSVGNEDSVWTRPTSNLGHLSQRNVNPYDALVENNGNGINLYNWASASLNSDQGLALVLNKEQDGEIGWDVCEANLQNGPNIFLINNILIAILGKSLTCVLSFQQASHFYGRFDNEDEDGEGRKRKNEDRPLLTYKRCKSLVCSSNNYSVKPFKKRRRVTFDSQVNFQEHELPYMKRFLFCILGGSCLTLRWARGRLTLISLPGNFHEDSRLELPWHRLHHGSSEPKAAGQSGGTFLAWQDDQDCVLFDVSPNWCHITTKDELGNKRTQSFGKHKRKQMIAKDFNLKFHSTLGKYLGGLALCDVQAFNQALLEKHLWRVLTTHQSPTISILALKYVDSKGSRLNSHYDPSVAGTIANLPLPVTGVKDRLIWTGATKGYYNVKDGYNWLLSNHSQQDTGFQTRHALVWQTVWRLRLPYRPKNNRHSYKSKRWSTATSLPNFGILVITATRKFKPRGSTHGLRKILLRVLLNNQVLTHMVYTLRDQQDLKVMHLLAIRKGI